MMIEEEAFGWLFVGDIPLLYEKKNVAKQLKIETWLDLAQAMKELGLNAPKQSQKHSLSSDYIA